MNTIDMSEQIEAIKDKFNPKYYLKPEATKEAAALWGGDNHNEHGVLETTKELIVEVGKCKGELRFCETSKGHWLIGLSAESSFNGFSYLPSVWDTVGYASYHDARLDGVLKLTEFFEKVFIDKSSTNSETNRADAAKALKVLHAEKNPQLGLF